MLKKKIYAIFYVLLIVAILAGCSSGGSGNVQVTSIGSNVLLKWSAPTTNSDGTRLTNLAGFKIYYGTASRIYSHVLDVGNVTKYTIVSLSPGAYYFAVTCYDASGRESDYSNEASKTIL